MITALGSWLLGKPAETRVVARLRTHDTRSEIAHAALTDAGAPDWEQTHTAAKAYDAARDVMKRVGTDPDVLIEALLWDTDIAEWCWSEAHERCCNEGFAHADDADDEATRALLYNKKRPAWITPKTWRRLRGKLARAEARGDIGLIAIIEQDDDLYDEIQNEGVARHVAECPRGSVGGNFHSIP